MKNYLLGVHGVHSVHVLERNAIIIVIYNVSFSKTKGGLNMNDIFNNILNVIAAHPVITLMGLLLLLILLKSGSK